MCASRLHPTMILNSAPAQSSAANGTLVRAPCPHQQRRKRQCRRDRAAAIQASSTPAGTLQGAASTSPAERALYRLLSSLAGWQPFLRVLRSAAFVVIRKTAEQRGIKWRHVVQELQDNPEVTTPSFWWAAFSSPKHKLGLSPASCKALPSRVHS